MWHELLDGIVKAFLAALAIGITSFGLYSQLWIVDFFRAKAHKRREDERLAEESKAFHSARVHLKPNGAAHHADDEDIDSDPDNPPAGDHLHKRRVRRGHSSSE